MNKPLANAKIAIFYDWLNNWGGAERVLINLLQLYPHAELFTLVHDPAKTQWLPKNIIVHPSFLNNFPNSKSNPIYYTPLYNLAIEQFNFSQFDILISTTSTIGHGLLAPPKTLYICYFHNLNRHVYLDPPPILLPILNIYKKIDQLLIHRPDYFFCNSKTVYNRLQTIYKISPKIIYPGVDTQKFVPTNNPTLDYYLVVGRQVPHKRIDIVIKYFMAHHTKKLIIAGQGRDHQKLVKLGHHSPNVIFIPNPSDTDLIKLYQNCLALICPQLEDFGITPLEAQACGRPVIGYRKGGNQETIISGKTGILFNQQTTQSLQLAIAKLSRLKISPRACRQNSLKFSDQNFMLNFNQHLTKLWQQHQTTTF
ncbi:MAG: glycosyltransferase [Microgenomates group bacterium]